MIPAFRAFAALALAAASAQACADDLHATFNSAVGQTGAHAASFAAGADGRFVDNGARDWRDMKAGLTHKLDGGWLLAMNYTRALGGAGPCDCAALSASRPDERPAFLRSGRRALVLSIARSF